MNYEDLFQMDCGLEVHIQLSTESKIFCADNTAFGANPNEQVSEVTLAYPGTLPVLNSKVLDYAIKLGLATNCEIKQYSAFDRKNYFYPDLPKSYQITQDYFPICKNGYVEIETSNQTKKIRINRIHIEEDAGKSIHDAEEKYSLIDLNRAGTPLLEMVTEPDIKSAEEAFAFLTYIRKLVKWIDICDGNMEEGSLRCDANISIRPKNSDILGNRNEIKNINSMRNLKRALEYEYERQCKLLMNNEVISQATRGFDADKGITFSQRSKEMAHDYRYFPDPDLPSVLTDEITIADIRKGLPVLPLEAEHILKTQYNLGKYEAQLICEDISIWHFFNEAMQFKISPKALSNIILNDLKSYCNSQKIAFEDLDIQAQKIAEIIQAVETKKITQNIAQQKVLPALFQNHQLNIENYIQHENLLNDNNDGDLEVLIDEILHSFPDKVKEYQKGKKGLLAMFVGEVMKRTKGKAEPKKVNEILLIKLN